jgi:hypothetical protein
MNLKKMSGKKYPGFSPAELQRVNQSVPFALHCMFASTVGTFSTPPLSR